jgi:eukaryotic-like serine/threonine-protein kinase
VSETANERFRRSDAVFDAVLDLPDEEQEAFVDVACGDDLELRDEVRRLLRAHHRADGMLDTPAVALARPFLEGSGLLPEPTPERIGPFRVVRAIGEGGMGQVFLGERADGQFEQRVALKLIRHGTPGLVRRFLEERRILALLEHPHIARLIDGGITPGGLPYFAMEYIEGEPIDAYCRTRDLSLEERLALFADVCEAVSYAHQHLIIHRDLKPSNILVTVDGQVKLLDFGIAKLLGAQATGTDVTHAEYRVMTPDVAAPEQIRGGPVSTATDVYSLGVLLYQLLSGERPYDLRGRSAAEIEHIVCEFEPPRPSAKAPAPLARRLRGELDLIVMTALRKDEARRYQSPAALAQELQRFLRGHPILAKADRASYRVRKFIGRHRTSVAAAALLVVALAGAASRERVLRTRAEVEARKAREVGGFLVGVFDVADPFAIAQPDGGSVTARELLDRGAARIDSTLVDVPEAQAELRSVLGRVYSNLGLYDKATPLLERALAQRDSLHGPRHASVATDKSLLGAALARQDRYDEAEPLLRDALAQRRRLLGDAHASTAESLENLATLLEERGDHDAAEPLHREALTIRRALFGDTAAVVATSLNNLGLIHYRKGEYDQADTLYRQSLGIQVRALGEDHPLTAQTMQNLAQTLQLRGKVAEAEPYFRRSLAAKRKALGDAHPSVTIGLNNLAHLVARVLGRLEEGEALTREALALDRRIFGDRHSFVAQSLSNLAVILGLKGEFTEAEQLAREALEMNRSLLGGRHRAVASNYGALAQIRYQRGDTDDALRLMREAYALHRSLLGAEHIFTLIPMVDLGRLLIESGRPEDAEPLLREALGTLDPANGAHRATYVGARRTLGEALTALGRADEALPILEEALGMARKEFGEDSWRTAQAQLAYGQALAAARRLPEAEPLVRAAHASLQKHRAGQPQLAAQAAAALQRLSDPRTP